MCPSKPHIGDVDGQFGSHDEINGGNKERLRKRTFYILYYTIEGSNSEILCPL